MEGTGAELEVEEGAGMVVVVVEGGRVVLEEVAGFPLFLTQSFVHGEIV